MKILDVPQSGSQNGTTSSRNRFGQYRRSRVSPVQPIGSGRRAVVRANFGACSTAWSGLTDAQRDAWSAFAEGHPYTDSLGQSIVLTGHQMFVAVNCNRLNCGNAINETPPGTTEVFSPGAVTVTATAGTQALTVAWSNTADGDFNAVAFSPPLSPGRRFPTRFWQAKVEPVAGSPYNALAAYVAEFGALTAGKRIFVKVTPINDDGMSGVPVIVSKIVAV